MDTYEVLILVGADGIDDVGAEEFKTRAGAIKSARHRSRQGPEAVYAVYLGQYKTDLFHFGERFIAK